MKMIKLNAISIALMTAGLAYSSVILAEEVKEQEVMDVIEVTGIRSSIIKAQLLKKDNSSIVEALTAEDIGKLPDVSIAESLARLPGLAGQRINGRTQTVSIRGMAPDFSTTLLNGRQMVSTGDNRSVEYDQYPSELLSGATVYKTPDASLIGQGIAGTVDLHTLKPLAHGKQTFFISGAYEKNEYEALNPDADNDGHRLTFSYIDQYADDTIGLMLGISSSEIATQSRRDGYWDGLLPAAWGGLSSTDANVPFEPGDLQMLGGIKPFAQSNTLKRNSVMGTIEYEPSDTFNTSVDIFYTDFEEDVLWRGIEQQLFWSGGAIEPGFTVENDIVTKGTVHIPTSVVHTKLDERESKLYAIGWNTQFSIGDDWQFETDLSYSRADRSDWNTQLQYYNTDPLNELSFELHEDGHQFSNSKDFTDRDKLKLGNPMGWGAEFVEGGHLGDTMNPRITDDMLQLKLAASYSLNNSFISQLHVGINFDRREKDKQHSQWSFALAEGASDSVPDDAVVMNDSFSGQGDFYALDPSSMHSDTYEWIKAENIGLSTRSWSVEEEIITAFVMADIDIDISDYYLSGNFGLQYIGVEQSSKANSASVIDGSLTLVPVELGASYSDLLPSLNLSLEITNSDVLRLGVSRSITRPRMDELRASSTYGLDPAKEKGTTLATTPWSAGGGNPALKPWKSDAIDLSFEHYFDDSTGYFALAAFYKELDSYVYNQPVETDFTGYDTGVLNPVYFKGFTSAPANGDGGTIHGFEASLALSGELIADFLSDFGTVLSGSMTESNILPNGPDAESSPLPGLSKNVYSATVYYEYNGFSARISTRYRDRYIGELPNFAAERTLRQTEAETLVDAQVSYAFTSGSLEGLTIMLQGINLTDEPYTAIVGDEKLAIVDQFTYGATYAFAASYKF
ncbi:TonB-dependent receptor [Shewanella sp.]|uniref:TonB-dependent receptor n=1 Tax=Shewanella sp. TaxID=50422 RepID=UPI001EB37C26|nr:TonB-dependent receptor [Shewanella sp.]NRB24666.1 TonB-dependent receptor [Shewanella sp.]